MEIDGSLLSNTEFYKNENSPKSQYRPRAQKNLTFISPFFYLILSTIIQSKKTENKVLLFKDNSFKKYFEKVSISPFSNFVGLEDTIFDEIIKDYSKGNNPKNFAHACEVSSKQFPSKMSKSIQTLLKYLSVYLPNDNDKENFLMCLFKKPNFYNIFQKMKFDEFKTNLFKLELVNWYINHPITQKAYFALRYI
jgi:hypothetical protein